MHRQEKGDRREGGGREREREREMQLPYLITYNIIFIDYCKILCSVYTSIIKEQGLYIQVAEINRDLAIVVYATFLWVGTIMQV